MRLVVTGGRSYRDTKRVFDELDSLHAKRPVSVLIQGEASGLDKRAKAWAIQRGISVESFPARWDEIDRPDAVVRYRRDGSAYDVTAGTRRNQQMIDEGRPDFGMVFPGGSGTADMRSRLVDFGIEFWNVV